jgi:HEPN domain-containing protein
MGSFDNATLLCKMALNYLRTAKDSFDKGIYDVSATNCQISAELPIKSTYLLLGVNFPQTYSIGKLLSGLAMVAGNYSEEIQRFIKEKRKELNLVELSRFEVQYSLVDVDAEYASDCLNFVEDYILPLIRNI